MQRADEPRLVDGDRPEHVGDARYRIVLHPAVGDGDKRKLVGCLEELTVDRVAGTVESFRTVAITAGR